MKTTTEHKYKNSRKKWQEEQWKHELVELKKETEKYTKPSQKWRRNWNENKECRRHVRDIKDKHTQHEQVFKMIKEKMTDERKIHKGRTNKNKIRVAKRENQNKQMK